MQVSRTSRDFCRSKIVAQPGRVISREWLQPLSLMEIKKDPFHSLPGLESISRVIGHLLVVGEDGDVALAQGANDDTFGPSR